ncbi:MAG: hypothetical protein IJH41_03895 [Eubacterium sp.]|nr:hypothetical protein [Eubacterium sp.]MBQ4457999.1 hypothetical protein [Clostridia bacterium]
MLTNPVAGKTFYGVYRIRDLNAPDHSGNRETRGYYETRKEAEALARRLNTEEAVK